jgi:hypothetical protein
MALAAIVPILGTFLVGLMITRIVKVLFSLGIGVVTFVGLDALLENVITEIEAAWALVPAGTYQLLSLGGIPEAMGIILGAFAVKVTMMTISFVGKVSTS